MLDRGRVTVFAMVALAHLALLYGLSRAMRPPVTVQVERDTVMYVEFYASQPPPEPEPTPEIEAEPETDAASLPEQPPEPVESAPPARSRPRPSVPMQAVFESPAPVVPDGDPDRELVAPERDPFSRPSAPVTDSGFGPRGQPQLRRPNRPAIAGEARPNAPLPPDAVRQRMWPQQWVELVGGILGGGPNAPVEAPCGGRLSGGFGTAEGFSPNWERDHGCGQQRDAAGFDGRVVLPPGTNPPQR